MMFTTLGAYALVATRCVCCRRGLKDALSAEIGMGPICRKRWGLETIPPADAVEGDLVEILLSTYGDLEEMNLQGRALANALVKRMASAPIGSRSGLGWIPRALDALGYRLLALRIAKTSGSAWVFEATGDGDTIVACPTGYLDELLARIPGAKRDRKAAGYRVPLLLTPDAQKALAGTFFSYKSADDGGLEFS